MNKIFFYFSLFAGKIPAGRVGIFIFLVSFMNSVYQVLNKILGVGSIGIVNQFSCEWGFQDVLGIIEVFSQITGERIGFVLEVSGIEALVSLVQEIWGVGSIDIVKVFKMNILWG